jgi:hypothetical protein
MLDVRKAHILRHTDPTQPPVIPEARSKVRKAA